MAAVTDAVERANALRALAEEVACCTRCPLHSTRTQAVFGSGHPDADLMFVGEAPGFHEDQQGVPFVGQAGKLLERLLAGIGLSRADVYIANVLKSRPPGNRDPQPEEIAACEGYLFRQIALIQPKLVKWWEKDLPRLVDWDALKVFSLKAPQKALWRPPVLSRRR